MTQTLDPARSEEALRPVDEKNLRRAAWAGSIGTALEDFDFTIYMMVIMGITFGTTLFAPETVDRDLLLEQDA